MTCFYIKKSLFTKALFYAQSLAPFMNPLDTRQFCLSALYLLCLYLLWMSVIFVSCLSDIYNNASRCDNRSSSSVLSA